MLITLMSILSMHFAYNLAYFESSTFLNDSFYRFRDFVRFAIYYTLY